MTNPITGCSCSSIITQGYLAGLAATAVMAIASAYLYKCSVHGLPNPVQLPTAVLFAGVAAGTVATISWIAQLALLESC